MHLHSYLTKLCALQRSAPYTGFVFSKHTNLSYCVQGFLTGLEVPSPRYEKGALKCRKGCMEVALDRVVWRLKGAGFFVPGPLPRFLYLLLYNSV